MPISTEYAKLCLYSVGERNGTRPRLLQDFFMLGPQPAENLFVGQVAADGIIFSWESNDKLSKQILTDREKEAIHGDPGKLMLNMVGVEFDKYALELTFNGQGYCCVPNMAWESLIDTYDFGRYHKSDHFLRTYWFRTGEGLLEFGFLIVGINEYPELMSVQDRGLQGLLEEATQALLPK